MKAFRSLSVMATLGLVAGLLAIGAPAQGQAAVTEVQFRFAGTAKVSPGIFLPGLDDSGNTSWSWGFTSSGCDAVGVQGSSPVAGSVCAVSGDGPLKPDLLPQPACGNSQGYSNGSPFGFADRIVMSGRSWTGELHWDGVAQGDPSYSLGSQLFLWGTMSSGSETVDVKLLLNASGGSNCIPQISAGGATSFTVNGVGVMTTKAV